MLPRVANPAQILLNTRFSHSVVPSHPMMTEVAAMSSQTATQTQKRTGPDV